MFIFKIVIVNKFLPNLERDGSDMSDKRLHAKWIWYPGDFELWLHKEMSIRRDERGSIIPPFWRLDTHYTNVKFTRYFELQKAEEVTILVEGRYNMWLDDGYVYGNPEKFTIGPGKHMLIISVIAEEIVPAIWVQGESLISDEQWTVSNNNHVSYPAASWKFTNPQDRPSYYKLKTEPYSPERAEPVIAASHADKLEREGLLLDFGKETFGYIRLKGVEGSGNVFIYYGESREEALDPEFCETFDKVFIDHAGMGSVFKVPASRAFRYVLIIGEDGITFSGADMLYEYLPVEKRGRFRSSNEKLNEIWKVSEHTLHLTTREFFIDGIKRDRWVWSGDAYQSFLMNYYTFFELDVTRRTFIALRGKDPVETHINHIMDYSFYWIIGMYDYYQYSGDLQFVRQMYTKVQSLLQFCIDRSNEDGFIFEFPGDWVFVDWAEIDNKGEVAVEQVLFCKSLEIGVQFAKLLEDVQSASLWSERASKLHGRIIDVFWDKQQGGLVHSRFEGRLNNHLTKYANMFALMFDYLDEARKESVLTRVLRNEQVQPITTPYMRFYELAARCEYGDHEQVLGEMLQYWGGMLDLGATSFWEKYDPREVGSQHYFMYNRKYGKSLCHSWGASPLYIIGKFFLGVRPLTPGGETYLIEPKLGGLEWIEGAVPLAGGDVEIAMNQESIHIKSTSGIGILRFTSKILPTINGIELKAAGSDHYYETEILPNTAYTVYYK